MSETNQGSPEANEAMVEIFQCTDQVESALVQEALVEAGIRFAFEASPDRSWEGMVDDLVGIGIIKVLESDAEEAMSVIQDALPDETEVEEVADEDESA